MPKFDYNIAKIVSMNCQQKEIDCVAYFSCEQKAKNYFCENNINITKEFPFIKAFAINISAQQISEICSKDFITYLSSNIKVTALTSVARKILEVEKTHLTGNGVTICFIDTGINPHIDLALAKNRIVKFVDFVNDKKHCYDDNGHGSFVCGVATSSGILSGGKYKGIATKSNIVGLKALDSSGEASVIKILEAMQWVYDNAKKYNIKVVCMSFGSEPLGYADPVMKGAEMLWQKGITVVAAAGNSGPKISTIKSPGISGKIITVGGFDDNRIDETFSPKYFEIANFSSRGPALNKFKPDVVAPSCDIVSLNYKGGYKKMSGTSVATPMIAGLCALLYEWNPNIKPMVVKKILMTCAEPISFNKNFEGYGYPIINKLLKNNSIKNYIN